MSVYEGLSSLRYNRVVSCPFAALVILMTKRRFIPILLSPILMLVSSEIATYRAQIDSEPTPESIELLAEDRAIELLESAFNYLAEQDKFSFEIDITYDNVFVTGEKVQYSAYQAIVAQRPDRLFIDYVGDLKVNQTFYDGETISMLDPDAGLYVTEEALPTIDELVLDLEERKGQSIPLSTLVLSDPLARISNSINDSTYLGTSYVNRVPAHHLLFTTDDKDFQIWLSEDENPLVQKVLITYKALSGQPQYTAVFGNWDFDPEVNDNVFTFVPAEADRQVDFLPQE